MRWPRDAHEAPRGAYRCAQKFCSSLLMDRWLRGSGFRGQATRGSRRQKRLITIVMNLAPSSCVTIARAGLSQGAFTANKCQVSSCSDVPWALPARSPEHSNAYLLWTVKPIMGLEARNVSMRRTRASGATTITWSRGATQSGFSLLVGSVRSLTFRGRPGPRMSRGRARPSGASRKIFSPELDGTLSPIPSSIGVARPDARAVTLRGTLTDVFG